MSYTIQAFILKNDSEMNNIDTGAVNLCQAFILIPIVEKLRGEYGIPFLPFTDEGDVSESTIRNILKHAPPGMCAYIEAEIFGGEGIQASLVAMNGIIIGELEISADAINNALRVIGVKCDGGLDEFDTMGLGKFRDTEKWVQQNNS